MKKTLFLISLFAAFISLPDRMLAGTTSSGQALLKSPSAVAQSMGEAFASISAEVGGVGSLHYNPASAAFLKEREVLFMGRNGIADDTFSSVVYGHPTAHGTFSTAFSYFGVGNIDLVDNQGRARSVQAQQDMVAKLNYGKSIGSSLGLGAGLKFLRSKLADSVSANAVAADLGAQYKWRHFSFGFAMQNIGPSLKYRNKEEPLPLTLRAGFSHQIDMSRSQVPGRLTWAFDVSQERQSELEKSFGMEYLINNMVAIRSGNRFNKDNGQLQIGFGFIVGQVQIDYDHLNLSDLNGVHTVSATYRFKK